MRWQHGRAMGREVAVRETAEDVGDLDHDRRQRPGHQLVKDARE